jgi:hypothetical protein
MPASVLAAGEEGRLAQPAAKGDSAVMANNWYMANLPK